MKNNKKVARGEVVANAMTSVGARQYPHLNEALAQMIPTSQAISSKSKPIKDAGMIENTTIVDDESDTPVKTNSIVKSRKRTSLDEFAHRTRMRPEIKAGFRAWMRGQHFAFDNEWQQLFNEYNNRKI